MQAKEFTMFIWASKTLARVDCSIVASVATEQDISRAKYVRHLKSGDMRITVVGTGDVLSVATLVQLAQSFKSGKWRRYTIEKGVNRAE